MVKSFKDTPGVNQKFSCNISSSTFWFENNKLNSATDFLKEIFITIRHISKFLDILSSVSNFLDELQREVLCACQYQTQSFNLFRVCMSCCLVAVHIQEC
mgnify:CR=1 FL=1